MLQLILIYESLNYTCPVCPTFTGSTIPSSPRPSVNFTMTTSQLVLHKPDKRTSAHNKKILSTCTCWLFWQFH